MKFIKLFIFLLIALSFGITGGIYSINTNYNLTLYNSTLKQTFEADSSKSVYQEIDEYLIDAYKKAHFPAMSVTIVNKEDVLLSKSYGNCKDTNTPFLLGSVSKSFTALCIMQLVEEGKIELEAPISRYLSKSCFNDIITVQQLLNHTSGLGEHQNLNDYKIVNKQGEHNYANVNYSLLGEIIEVVSGLSYEDYVTKKIFEPLSMTKSSATYDKAKENGLIDTYENWFGINIKTKPKYPKSKNAWITTSAGYLSSSTTDLGKYLQMYLNGGKGIISNESINKMFYDNVEVKANIPYKYGMGWTLINNPLPEPALRHAGLVETGMSTIYILPEREIGIAVTANTNDYFVGKDIMDRIDWSIALMLMGENPNQIGANEYVTRHLLYDFAYLAVIILSILPLCLIAVYKKRILKGKLWVKKLMLVLLHTVLPTFILLLPQIFFATPLWVVKDFVPDMFTTTIVSSFTLFIGGIVKLFLILYNNKNKKMY